MAECPKKEVCLVEIKAQLQLDEEAADRAKSSLLFALEWVTGLAFVIAIGLGGWALIETVGNGQDIVALEQKTEKNGEDIDRLEKAVGTLQDGIDGLPDRIVKKLDERDKK